MSNSFATSWTIAQSGSSGHGISWGRILEGVALSSLFPGGLPEPRIEPTSPSLAGGFFTVEPPGEPIMVEAYYCIFVQTHNVQHQEQTLI